MECSWPYDTGAMLYGILYLLNRLHSSTPSHHLNKIVQLEKGGEYRCFIFIFIDRLALGRNDEV